MSSSKGQVTLFVIIGLILLIILFVIMQTLKTEQQVPFTPDEVPELYKPVENYVENCMRQITLDALVKMGAHGGYVDPLSPELAPIVLKYLPSQPTRSDLASLTGAQQAAVPFYLHVPGRASYSNYNIESLAPTIESQQLMLARYVDTKLAQCTAGFEGFEDFEVEVSETPQTTVIIKDDDILVQTVFPLNATRDDVKREISRFSQSVKFPYKAYYDLAIDITTAAFASQFSESFTTSLIAYHSGTSQSRLPPFMSVDERPYATSWPKSKVTQDLNTLLVSYVPALQVIGTKDYVEPSDPDEILDAFLKSLQLEIFEDTLPEKSITFIYKDRTLELNVQPSKGELIRPSVYVETGQGSIPETKTNTYRFFYDVAYPIFVEIRGIEPDSEIPEFSFIFAIESNLIENKAALAWMLGYGTAEWDESDLNVTYSIPDDALIDQEGSPVKIELRKPSKSLFCDEQTWTSGIISLNAFDSDGILADATVTYSCGDYDSCFVGKTDTRGLWEGILPICLGGTLSVSKEGYGSKSMPLTTYDDTDQWLGSAVLDKVKRIIVWVEKAQIDKEFLRDDEWVWSEGFDSLGSVESLSGSEQVTLVINQVGVAAGASPISTNVVFGKDGDQWAEIDLVPGEYEISASLIDYDGVEVPAGCDRECSDRGFLGIGCTDYLYYPEEPISINPAPWGGLEITSETGYFIVPAAELDASSNLYVTVLKLPDLRYSTPPGACIIALEEMGRLKEYSNKYASSIWPRFT